MSKATATANALDDMVMGVMGRKADKAALLTPVGTERRGTTTDTFPEVPGVFLTHEALADVAKDLRRQAALLLEVADGLDIMVRTPEAPALAVVDTKAAEKAADERALALTPEAQGIVDRMTSISAEAKASVHGDADDDEPVETPSGWQCPEHGLDNVVTLTSRKGRTYLSCTGDNCREFEK